jgi:GT2 family glycosyltransferase
MVLDKTAILIPTRNRPAILANTLVELRKRGLEAVALWVYDDASDDPEAVSRVVREGWQNAELICGGKRVGQAEARNVLMRACRAEFGIMLEDDVYFLELGRLEDHVGQRKHHPERAVVQFKCVARGTGNQNMPDRVGPSEVSSFLGGASLFHIPSILSVGGYRGFLVYGYEEPDLAMRLWGHDFRIWYDPSIHAEHNQWYSPEERRDFEEYDYLYARNSVLLATMNTPLWMGLAVGLSRSLRRALLYKRNYRAKALGLLHGIWITFSRWRDRTPLSAEDARRYWRFCRTATVGMKTNA